MIHIHPLYFTPLLQASEDQVERNRNLDVSHPDRSEECCRCGKAVRTDQPHWRTKETINGGQVSNHPARPSVKDIPLEDHPGFDSGNDPSGTFALGSRCAGMYDPAFVSLDPGFDPVQTLGDR